MAPDLIVDIPKLWENIGQSLAGAFMALPPQDRKQLFTTCFKSVLGTPASGKIASSLLLAAASQKVHCCWAVSILMTLLVTHRVKRRRALLGPAVA